MVDRRLPSPLDHGSIVIDYGCGARPYGNIQIDLPSEESDKHHIGESVPPTIFASADRNLIPLRDGIADRHLWLHILEHLTQPYDALKDGYRVLKKGGSTRIEEPNPRLWEHERDEHLYSWHPDTFHNIVKATGYTIITYHQGGKNHSIEAKKE